MTTITAATVTSTAKKVIPRWLGIGTKVTTNTIDEILNEAGLNWTISKRPLLTVNEIPEKTEKINPRVLGPNGTAKTDALKSRVQELVETNFNESHFGALNVEVANLISETKDEFIPLQEQYCIVRDDTKYVFTTVGKLYTCIQNEECLGVLSNLITDYGLKVECAGTFMNGAAVWVVAAMPETIMVNGESLSQYVRIMWAHDGTEKLTARFVYLDDQNHIISPKIRGAEEEISIRHTKSAHDRTEDAKKIIARQRKHAEKFVEFASKMGVEHCTTFREYMKEIFPNCDKIIVDEHGYSQEDSNKDRKTVDQLEVDFSKTKQNFWDAFLTVVDYADTQKSTRVHGKTEYTTASEEDQMRKENLLRNNLKSDGTSMKLKQRAWETLTKPIMA